MKWYIASRTRNREEVHKWANKLSQMGHNLIFDWTLLEGIEPYNKNIDACKRISEELSKSIPNADIFVLLCDSGGTDMFVELGIAIGSFLERGSPKIYLVGENNKRSLMHLHPSITHFRKVEEVFEKECPNLLDD